MLHYLGSTHFAANACSPWKNGHCERLNRSLKTALCAKRNLANWVISYPWSIFLLHTVHRQDFGASSAQMLYGMNLQLTNQFYPTHHDDSNSPASAAACLQYRMGAFHYTSTRFPSTRRHMWTNAFPGVEDWSYAKLTAFKLIRTQMWARYVRSSFTKTKCVRAHATSLCGTKLPWLRWLKPACRCVTLKMVK